MVLAWRDAFLMRLEWYLVSALSLSYSLILIFIMVLIFFFLFLSLLSRLLYFYISFFHLPSSVHRVLINKFGKDPDK